MTPVNQLISDSERGDCMRATIASLLDLELPQVPHFGLFSNKEWYGVMWYFFYSLGWEHMGTHRIHKNKPLVREDSINDYFYAIVPSRVFEGKTHAVVMDLNGVVVHDPSPNKAWQGVQIYPHKIKGWYVFKKREES